MRQKNKGVYVSVRLLDKHTRTSEEWSRKPLIYGQYEWGVEPEERWEKWLFMDDSGVKPGGRGHAQGRHGARSAMRRLPPSQEQQRIVLTIVSHIILQARWIREARWQTESLLSISKRFLG
jgi:hypothetical protein